MTQFPGPNIKSTMYTSLFEKFNKATKSIRVVRQALRVNTSRDSKVLQTK